MEMNDVCEKAFRVFGTQSQIIKTIEEMGELTVALSRYANANALKLRPVRPISELYDQLAEEIADVTIMLNQMSMLVDSHDVNMWIDRKLSRLNKILKEETTGA